MKEIQRLKNPAKVNGMLPDCCRSVTFVYFAKAFHSKAQINFNLINLEKRIVDPDFQEQ